MSREIQIKGGAGPQETAAIMAAVQHLIEEEAASQAMVPPRNIANAWVRSGQRRVVKPARQTETGLSTREITGGLVS